MGFNNFIFDVALLQWASTFRESRYKFILERGIDMQNLDNPADCYQRKLPQMAALPLTTLSLYKYMVFEFSNRRHRGHHVPS
jgi:hypothetical protein